tara:strand:- start:98 stop:763 length:666 start_codon:yes stop_codon:yes gene_type:complete
MAIITSGKTFANGEQLSASKLNQVITGATFTQGAIDSGSMQIVGDAISVRDDGITTAKIADSNVTKAKIENVANMKALGNTSGSANSPQEVAILDEDNMSSDSATSLATQKSIKAYVDAGDANQIGVGQTWQDVKTSRSINTWFQNTTGRPIQVVISITSDGSNTGSVQVATDSSSSSTYITLSQIGTAVSESGTTFTIPNNYYYRYASTGTTLRTWCELR